MTEPRPGDMRTARDRLATLVPDETTMDAVLDGIARLAEPGQALERLADIVDADPSIASRPSSLRRASAIASASLVLSRALTHHPQLLEGSPPEAPVALRVQAALIEIAGDDLSGAVELPEATRRFSDAIDRIVADALARARDEVAERHPMVHRLPFTVIAMGKWGARELNYASDVDLMLVHDMVEGEGSQTRATALALASRLVSILSDSTTDGRGLEVDLDLRPEGTMGPLSRSLEGYTRYYEQWGEAWELQALLKARPAAGDPDLGRRFMDLTDQVIWERGLDVEALRSIRKIKEQVEQGASPNDIKRSRGGIRDVEFSVQLLQLVHGRLDPDLRRPATLDALDALASHGYIDDSDRERLAAAYAFLRNLEHRLQLWELRQTHELPSDPVGRERLARSVGLTTEPLAELDEKLAAVRSVVRDVHERLYFRPILDALVGSPSARLGMDQAALRLEALGFTNLRAATEALEELTTGLSRRSRVMNQVLPLMLDWLSLSPNPDLGLAQLRLVLAHTPDHAALVTLLQTNPLAGERLCRLLGTGRLLGELIDRIPEFIPRLADEAKLSEIRPREAEMERLLGLLDSRPGLDAKIGTVRRFSRRRKLRIAARDVLGEASTRATLIALSDTGDTAVGGAVHIAGEGDSRDFAVIAMGRWGGHELSYGSDLDLMYVFGDEDHRDRALHLATDLGRILSEPSKHGDAYRLDAGIRPEGRSGPLARSVDSYLRYYEEWAQPWEILALIRARPAAGDVDLGTTFLDTLSSLVWRPHFSPEFVRDIRVIKARVENERIPPGDDPDYHLKLGRGSLSDVEFLTQLLQLQYGHHEPWLRAQGTIDALERLWELGLITAAEHNALEESYVFCTRVRLRLHLQAGRPSDSLPMDPDELIRLATSLGFDRASELREQYLRVTRRARHVFEKRFYE